MKKLKGFTLIELIIVMAILSILMVGIMQMMKPIRNTFIDSTYYEAQRTTQNGMVEYITENLRYADNIGIYTKGKSFSGKTVNNVVDAITYFKADVKNDDGTELSDSQINIITIDNTLDYQYGNSKYRGRIVRSKALMSGNYTVNAEKPGTTQARLALGDAYYGECNYSIKLEPDGKNIKLTVASLIATSMGAEKKAQAVKTEKINDGSQTKVVQTEGYVVCQNLDLSGNQFKTDFADLTTTQDKNTYIVFTLPEHN